MARETGRDAVHGHVDRLTKEVRERNSLRASAGLPPINLDDELEKAEAVEYEKSFEEFFESSPLRQEIEARVLADMRRQHGDENWKPAGMLGGGGMLFHARVRNAMIDIFERRQSKAD